jgi:hypothetical protein
LKRLVVSRELDVAEKNCLHVQEGYKLGSLAPCVINVALPPPPELNGFTTQKAVFVTVADISSIPADKLHRLFHTSTHDFAQLLFTQ